MSRPVAESGTETFGLPTQTTPHLIAKLRLIDPALLAHILKDTK
jgi:hypothetical protein